MIKKISKAEPKYKNGIYHHLQNKVLGPLYKGIIIWMSISLTLHYICMRFGYKRSLTDFQNFEDSNFVSQHNYLINSTNAQIRASLHTSRALVSNYQQSKYDSSKNYYNTFSTQFYDIETVLSNGEFTNSHIFAVWSNTTANAKLELLNFVSYFHPFWNLMKSSQKVKATEFISLQENFYYTNSDTLDLLMYQDMCLQQNPSETCINRYNSDLCAYIQAICSDMLGCITENNSYGTIYDVRCIPEISALKKDDTLQIFQANFTNFPRVCAYLTTAVICNVFWPDQGQFDLRDYGNDSQLVAINIYSSDLQTAMGTSFLSNTLTASKGFNSSCSITDLQVALKNLTGDSNYNYTNLMENGYGISYQELDPCKLKILASPATFSLASSLVGSSDGDSRNLAGSNYVIAITLQNNTVETIEEMVQKDTRILNRLFCRMSGEVLIIHVLTLIIARLCKNLANDIQNFIKKLIALLKRIEGKKDNPMTRSWIDHEANEHNRILEASMDARSNYPDSHFGSPDGSAWQSLDRIPIDGENTELMHHRRLSIGKDQDYLKSPQDLIDLYGRYLPAFESLLTTNIYELEELKHETLNFGYVVTYHRQRRAKCLQADTLFRVAKIFKEKANGNGIEIVYDFIVKYLLDNKDYKSAIQYMKEIAELLERRKDKLLYKKEEYTDEMENTDWRLFINYYRILNVVKRDLMSQDMNQRPYWDYAMDIFRKIFSFVEDMEVQNTVIAKLMLKKASILVYLGKPGHALETLQEIQAFYNETLKYEKLQSQLNFENKMLCYLQQKIYLTFGKMYLCSKEYENAYKYYMKSLEYGSNYTPQIRIRCLEGISEILSSLDAPENQQIFVKRLQGFFSETSRRFMFLVDSTEPLNNNLSQVMAVIKEFFFKKMKDRDRFSVFRFSDEISEVMSFVKYENIKSNFTSSFDMIYDQLKKHAHKKERMLVQSVAQAIQLFATCKDSDTEEDNERCMVNGKAYNEKPKYLIVITFGDEHKTNASPTLRKNDRRMMSRLFAARGQEMTLDHYFERIEDSFVYLLLVVMDKDVKPDSASMKSFKRVYQSAKVGSMVMADPSKPDLFNESLKEIVEFVEIEKNN